MKVAGGASCHEDGQEDSFQIGKRNILMLRKLFWKNGIIIQAEHVGGHMARTMSLEIGAGAVILKIGGREFLL